MAESGSWDRSPDDPRVFSGPVYYDRGANRFTQLRGEGASGMLRFSTLQEYFVDSRTVTLDRSMPSAYLESLRYVEDIEKLVEAAEDIYGWRVRKDLESEQALNATTGTLGD